PIVFINTIIFIICFSFFIRDFSTLLIIVAILPFAYTERGFSRYFVNVLLQNITIYLICLFALFQYLHYGNSGKKILNSYIGFPILILSIYALLLALLGYIKAYSLSLIIQEYYQTFYYFLTIPFLFL